jgi:hypothetical protein
MHKHKEAQDGHVELNIGGERFQTSVQALRRVPHTFFDAYFSGRYAQDVCRDGSIFVDRDGEHFEHVLQYMRDGVVSVAEPGTHPTVSLLRALKREFGFYCIQLCAEPEPVPPGAAFIMGGVYDVVNSQSCMTRYDASSGQWSGEGEMASMGTARAAFGACVIAGEVYVTGGEDVIGELGVLDFEERRLSSAERNSPWNDTWSAITPLPVARSRHAAVAVGSTMFVLGGKVRAGTASSVLKFDSTQGTWSYVAPMPESRSDLAACTIGSDIYVFGGADRDDPLASVFMFDTVTNVWSTLVPLPTVCASHSAYVLDGQIYIVGAGAVSNEVLGFDPMSGVWNTLTRTRQSRALGSSFVLDGSLYAAGGFGGGDRGTAASCNVECYDVATDTWTDVVDMPAELFVFCAVTIESKSTAEEQDHFDSLIAKVH